MYLDMRITCRMFRVNSNNFVQSLYYSALIKLSQIIENMMLKIINVNVVKKRYCTALTTTLINNYEKMIQILLKIEIDVKLKKNIMITNVVLICMI